MLASAYPRSADDLALLSPQPLHRRLPDLLEEHGAVAAGTGGEGAADEAVHPLFGAEGGRAGGHALPARLRQSRGARGADLRGPAGAGARRTADGAVALGRARAQGAGAAGVDAA